MTLVAAFKVENVPVLMGDMLITQDASTRSHNLFLPTQPGHSDTLGGRVRIGAGLKTLVLNNRLAVGFTGEVWAGRELFRELTTRYSNKTPTGEELNLALRLCNNRLNKKAHLVGWLAHPDPVCFRWSAGAGAHVQWVSQAIMGSGSPHFEKELLGGPRMVGGSNDFSPQEKAIFVTVSKAVQATAMELETASTWDRHYGYGFEILTWSGEHFEYQKKITSLFCNVVLDENLANGETVWTFARMYERRGEWAAMQSVPLREHVGPDGVVRDQFYLEQLAPLHVEDVGANLTRGDIIDPRSPLYSVTLSVTDPHTQATARATIVLDSKLVIIEGNSTKFNVQVDLRDIMPGIRQQFSLIRTAMKSAG
jgi:hypothetical protein